MLAAWRLSLSVALVALASRLVAGVRDRASVNESMLTIAHHNETQSTGEPPSLGDYKVTLLVTRHGLSCPNIAQMWGVSSDATRGLIHDPLTAGAAHAHAKTAGEAASGWLRAQDLELDAVVSSILARAIETAALTYPQPHAALHVVPFLREDASGRSNSPKKQAEQVAALTKSLPDATPFHLDYDWVDVLGSDEHSWERFEVFLAQSFLPRLISEKGKTPGSNIVIAVVTHSKLVAKSTLKEGCQEFWVSRHASKPLNNQILAVRYKFTIASPGADSVDWTPRRTLTRSSFEQDGHVCKEVFGGASEYKTPISAGNLHNLCFNDIGDSCHGPLKTARIAQAKVYSNILEAQIVKLAEQLVSQASDHLKLKMSAMPASFGKWMQASDQFKTSAAIMGTLAGMRTLFGSKCYGGGQPQVEAFMNARPVSNLVHVAVQFARHDFSAYQDQVVAASLTSRATSRWFHVYPVQ